MSAAEALAPWPAVSEQVSSLITILRRGTLHDSRTLSGLAAGLLKGLVSSPESAKLSVAAVLWALHLLADQFAASAPAQFAVSSVPRRVAALIDEEVAKLSVGAAVSTSIAAVRERAIRALNADRSISSPDLCSRLEV
jgi:hypothetical protein